MSFYPFGTILRRETADGGVEYPVSPAAVAKLLADNLPEQSFSTGLIAGDTLLVHQKGEKRTVIEYRKPQLSGLWLEGSDAPVRIPLPGLIMIRATVGLEQPSYRVLAVKRRPKDLNVKLYIPPLPNVSTSGVCWGTVAKPKDIHPTDLAEDWKMLLGSAFGNHDVMRKSRTFPQDIRQHYGVLEKTEARAYPSIDLIDANMRLSDLVKDLT